MGVGGGGLLTFMVASLEPLQNLRLGSALWAGSQAREVIHFVCPANIF